MLAKREAKGKRGSATSSPNGTEPDQDTGAGLVPNAPVSEVKDDHELGGGLGRRLLTDDLFGLWLRCCSGW